MDLTNKNTIHEKYDICVIGAGHAGCEAALASARLGLATIMFTVSVDSIALMPCNPNIGGSSKGHLVRELDALGGEMGKNIDKTFIQSKMLNSSKGPAVHSLRAQADKADYSRAMRKVLESQDNLTIKQGEVCQIVTNTDLGIDADKQYICGIRSFTGAFYECKAVIIASGTYLNARCLCGEAITYTGPNGLQAATHLTMSLEQHGVKLRRFKTGTPARMDGRSIDFSKMEEQFGDKKVVPFSFSTNPDLVQINQASCFLTYTNDQTHKIINANLDRSPIYAGIIEGTGPRYCPSIEDKVVKFADKERHQVFLEPEGLHTNEWYVGGMSSSLPEDVQLAMYRTVPGLENCQMVRNAYAIEYDCLCPKQLKPTLELKVIDNLYAAGQFNGSSGYEEAAVQGFMAGVNAAMKILGKDEVVLDRSEAYIGVLIDDLVTKDNREPYRMMTSRAEYRLLLRQDNADLRLRGIGHKIGLVDDLTYQRLLKKQEIINNETNRMFNTTVGANKVIQDFLQSKGSALVKKSTTFAELICRPELDYDTLLDIDTERKELFNTYFSSCDFVNSLDIFNDNFVKDIINQVNINVKYDGYIKRQEQQVKGFKKMESRKIPSDINYDDVPSLRLEARQKLKEFLPVSVGQASRISGVSPADVSVLLVYLDARLKKKSDN